MLYWARLLCYLGRPQIGKWSITGAFSMRGISMTDTPFRRSWTHHMQGTRGVSLRLPTLVTSVRVLTSSRS